MRIISPARFIAIGLIITLFTSCGNRDSDRNGMVIGSVHGIISDESSNARLDSVNVYWINNGELQSTQTDSLGYYAISELSTGEYEITFSKDGEFATGTVSVTIPSFQDLESVEHLPKNSDYPYSETQDVELFGLTSELTGLIYKAEDVENIILADGVTVIADFSSYNISPNEYSVQTDNSGKFDFINLPATSSVTLKVLPYNDGSYDYSMEFSTASLIPNEKTYASDIIMNIAPASPFIVQNNFESNDFELDSDIIISFSKFMNVNSFDISLSSSDFGNVTFESTWSNNNITLNIDPLVTLQANTTYNLSISGYSLDNNSYTGYYTFATIEGIEFISTNLERVDGVYNNFPISSNIELTFSMDVDLDVSDGYVYLEEYYGNSVESVVTASANKVIINPSSNLELGSQYTIEWRVYSSIVSDYDYGYIFFTTETE